METALRMNPEKITEVRIPIGKIILEGNLVVPQDATSIVIFSHGSGSSRFSPRNNSVAKVLHKEKIATLLIDLLTQEEDQIYENRFNIDLLTQRLIQVTKWIWSLEGFRQFSTGYFGASTGAASALRAAAELQDHIAAVVSRGGRPDLAGNSLSKVKSPTLLIIGSLDFQIFGINQSAFDQLRCEKKMVFVDGATHLFEEPGKLEEVSKLAAEWFGKYLVSHHAKEMEKDKIS